MKVIAQGAAFLSSISRKKIVSEISSWPYTNEGDFGIGVEQSKPHAFSLNADLLCAPSQLLIMKIKHRAILSEDQTSVYEGDETSMYNLGKSSV